MGSSSVAGRRRGMYRSVTNARPGSRVPGDPWPYRRFSGSRIGLQVTALVGDSGRNTESTCKSVWTVPACAQSDPTFFDKESSSCL